MEEEIKVGEWIRTRSGLIRKVKTIISGKRQYVRTTETLINGRFRPEDIKKHHKDITELIGVGDYVNGLEVYKGRVASGKEKLLVRNHIISGMSLEAVNIKTILTKEQFKKLEYKIETEEKQ